METDTRCQKQLRIRDKTEAKLLSLIIKSTGDYVLKKKIGKNDKMLDAITDGIHEYMYEKLDDSPETEGKKKIRYLNKWKTRPTKEQGQVEKANNTDNTSFVSPAVITVKKEMSVEIAIDSQKFYEIIVKPKAQMPNMEELASRKTADGPADEEWF